MNEMDKKTMKEIGEVVRSLVRDGRMVKAAWGAWRVFDASGGGRDGEAAGVARRQFVGVLRAMRARLDHMLELADPTGEDQSR